MYLPSLEQVIDVAGGWLRHVPGLGDDKLDLHMADFEIWWGSIRANAILRSKLWLERATRTM